MADQPKPRPKSKFSAEDFKARCEQIVRDLCQMVAAVEKMDWLGNAWQHPPSSEEFDLALVREELDLAFGHLMGMLGLLTYQRAIKTRCSFLLTTAIDMQLGNGSQMLELMRRYHALCPEDACQDGDPPEDSYPDLFAWETYERVVALGNLAGEFPKLMRHSARKMHGWPMIVTQHLDHTAEFQRLAELLELGAEYPLDVRPRKRRATETALLHYLEPLVGHAYYARKWIREFMKPHGSEADYQQYSQAATAATRGARSDAEEKEAILDRSAALPPLTKESAAVWSREVIVPLIMLTDAATSETCQIPALRNIWKHRAVKSRATFQSRLHSAVVDTLKRFGRPGGS